MDTIVLNPIASVNPDNCSVTMSALIPQAWFLEQTLIQIEYNIANDTSVFSGFISYETGWQCNGILNQLTIGIPCTTEPIDYTGNTKVKVRAYFGSKLTSSITVSDWSNIEPFFNSPNQPIIKNAFLSPGALVVPPDDIMCIELAPNDSYFLNSSDVNTAVQFIVSCNYEDISGNTIWKVTNLLNGTKYVSGDTYTILLDDFTLSPDAKLDISANIVYTAVNAVYEFRNESNTNSYYSVSKISPTVNAKFLNPGAADLELPIYHIYDQVNPSQTITLNWSAPDGSAFLPVDGYKLLVSVNDGSFNIIGEFGSNTFTYDWSITPQNLLLSETTNKLTFKVNTYYATQYYPSNTQYLYTYVYATEPNNLSIRYAIPVENDGVQLEFSFQNPVRNGQGFNPSFIYEVFNSDNNVLDISGEISYVYGSQIYTKTVFLDNLLTVPSAVYVKVYMETENTNPDPPGNLPGAVATSSSKYVVSPPIIERIIKNITTNTIHVLILSGEPLGVSNQFEIFNTGTQSLISLPFEVTDGTNYEVNITQENMIFIYNYIFYSSFFPAGSLPIQSSVFASNSSGIGVLTNNNIQST